ncbi:Cytochrome P450 3A41 [Trichoplax sp. H2]|nr:Cytochrome P450 3A41 [Trichoplax sp. H2]|eukprot:RDD40234.1 Cytochrome P450 3A41 [Trichoplax sp. H2]
MKVINVNLTSYSFLGYSIAFLTIALWCYIKYIRLVNFFKKQRIPSPKPKLLTITALNEYFKTCSALHVLQIDGIKKYGNVYGIFIGRIPCYVIADVDIIKQITVDDFCHFPNRPTIRNGFLDDGLFNLQDCQWKRIRNILAPAFSAVKMRQLVPLMNSSIKAHLHRLANFVNTAQPIDYTRWANDVTLEIIIANVFGMTANIQTDREDKLVQCATSMFQIRSYVAILTFLCPSFARYWIMLDRKFCNSLQYIEFMIKAIIQQRKKMDNDEKSCQDLLQLMLNSAVGDHSIKLIDDEIICQAITFLMAGYRTTGTSITLLGYMLALHPEIQDKVIAEVKKICLDEPEITYHMILQMEYLEMVLQEVLRLYPPDFFILRRTKYDIKMKTYHFNKGAIILIPVYGIHHHQLYWVEPEKFDPDRFTKEEKGKREPCCYLPFGYGPRNCIGTRFSIMQIKLVLASILRRYKFTTCQQTEIPLQLESTSILGPKNSIILQVQSN